MTKRDKLLRRFLSNPKDFTYSDAIKVLRQFGYVESNKGKTSGSRVAFIHKEKRRAILMHKPHKGVLKPYQMRDIKAELIHAGFLKEGQE